MKRLYFENYEDFVEHISYKYRVIGNLNDISIIAKYDDTRHIIEELVLDGYDLGTISLESVDISGYDDEYILTIFDGEIWCEPFKRDAKYISDESDITYILDNCSSKVINYCKGEITYEVCINEVENTEEFDDTNECTCNDCNCKHVNSKEDNTAVSPIVYKVNGKEVDKSTYDNVLHSFTKKCEEFDKIYYHNMKDMLLRYCELYDEVNEWRKLFY